MNAGLLHHASPRPGLTHPHQGWWRLLTALILLVASVAARPDTLTPAHAWVTLEASDDALCLAHGGQRISLVWTDAGRIAAPEGVVVWLDRWFMQVQTADHTRHEIHAAHPSQALGCTQTIAGPQHWTVDRVTPLPVQTP